MKVCIVGTGYVGLVTGTCFSEMGNDVICVDIDKNKIENLRNNIIPIYEPGLEEMVKRNQKEKRLEFTTDIKYAVEKSLIIFIAVGTPPDKDGNADMRYVYSVASNIGKSVNSYKIIVNKSTVPIGTADKVKDIIQTELDKRGVDLEFDLVSNPEFLKEGDAINDFMKPDRVIIGVDNVRVAEIIKELYNPFVRNNHPILTMDIRSAEMTKYAANCMLASRISFMNEIANICEHLGADIAQVRLGIGTDSRIGLSFLYPGVGYGGSCFPKDVQALIKISEEHGVDSNILKSIEDVNAAQKKVLIKKILKHFDGELKDKVIAIWGLAFKPNTDDMREAPSIVIINELIRLGAICNVYDPVANEEAKRIFCDYDNVFYFDNQYDALINSDAMVLVTEWHNFRRPDFDKIRSLMKNLVVFDGRNQYEPKDMHKMGFAYYCIGRPEVII